MRINGPCLIVLIILLYACHSTPSVNSNLSSISIKDKQDRIQTLSKYVNLKSAISDCEFYLFNVNGFNNERLSVPGASSWDYRFGVIISRSDVPKWTSNLRDTTFETADYSWILELIKKRPGSWSLHSNPKFYVNNSADNIIVVYEKEGVIFQKISNP